MFDKIILLLFVIFNTSLFARFDSYFYVEGPERTVLEQPRLHNYVGAGASFNKVEDDYLMIGDREITTLQYSSILLKSGYKADKNLSFEFRHIRSISKRSEDVYTNISLPEDGSYAYFHSTGLYMKPQFFLTEPFSIYGLFGLTYTLVDGKSQWQYNLLNDFDFSWGIGAEYSVNDEISFFVDYSTLFDNTYQKFYDYSPQLSEVNSVCLGLNFYF